MTGEDLIAEIVAAPDDVAVSLVYADWLQQRGDPRGRLIAVQAARATAGGKDDGALAAEEAALIAAHESLRGPDVDLEPPPTVDWHLGFWRMLGLGGYGWSAKPATRDIATALLAAPSARLLREINIRGDAAVEAVDAIAAHHRTLTTLALSASEDAFDDDALRALGGCRELRTLELFSCERVSARGIAPIAAMRSLAKLDLRNCPLDDAGAAHLVGLPLREVMFNAIGALTQAGVRSLARAPLVELDLDGEALGDAHVQPLAFHGTLARLSLHGAPIGDRGARALGSLRALRTLELHASTLPGSAVHELAGLSSLRVLDLGHAGAIDDAACAALARMPELRGLDLGSTRVTGAGLRALRGLPLRALDLSFLHLDDDAVRELLAFPDLEQLALGWDDVTDGVVATLAQLPRLDTLDLAATAITAAGIERLTAMPALESIGLYDCDRNAIERALARSEWYVATRDSLDLDLARYAG